MNSLVYTHLFTKQYGLLCLGDFPAASLKDMGSSRFLKVHPGKKQWDKLASSQCLSSENRKLPLENTQMRFCCMLHSEYYKAGNLSAVEKEMKNYCLQGCLLEALVLSLINYINNFKNTNQLMDDLAMAKAINNFKGLQVLDARSVKVEFVGTGQALKNCKINFGSLRPAVMIHQTLFIGGRTDGPHLTSPL